MVPALRDANISVAVSVIAKLIMHSPDLLMQHVLVPERLRRPISAEVLQLIPSEKRIWNTQLQVKKSSRRNQESFPTFHEVAGI